MFMGPGSHLQILVCVKPGSNVIISLKIEPVLMDILHPEESTMLLSMFSHI